GNQRSTAERRCQLGNAILAKFLGAFVAGIAGFAFGLIAWAVRLHVITQAQSAVLLAAYAVLIQGATLWKLRHAVQIRRLAPFLVGGGIVIRLVASHRVTGTESPDCKVMALWEISCRAAKC